MIDSPQLSISIIVPAYRAESYIHKTVKALRVAGASADDILVVDDASDDKTLAVAESAGARVLRLDQNLGPAAARNAGAAEATHADILLFVDADVVVHTDAVNRIRQAFQSDPSLTALFGAYDTRPEAPERLSRLRNLLHHWGHSTASGEATTFWTGLGAVRQSAFAAIGGFDATLDFMEDVDFGMRLWKAGGMLKLDHSIQGTHLKQWTLGSIIKTDLFGRAIPWSRLLLDAGNRDVPKSLNAGRTGQACVLAVAVSLLALVFMPVLPFALSIALIFASLTLIWLTHASFFRLIERLPTDATERGDKPAALFLLWLIYLLAGCGFAWVLGETAVQAAASSVKSLRSNSS